MSGPRIGAAAAALVVAAALSACASPTETLTDAVGAGVSAVGASSLALELNQAGDATRPHTDTVLADAVTELTDADRTVAELVPADEAEERQRADVRQALDAALDAVTGARAALAQGRSLDDWPAALDAARSGLEGAAP